jgi:hypothetical protein
VRVEIMFPPNKVYILHYTGSEKYTGGSRKDGLVDIGIYGISIRHYKDKMSDSQAALRER